MPSTITVDDKHGKKARLMPNGKTVWLGYRNIWPMRTDGQIVATCTDTPDLRPAAVQCDREALTCQKKSQCTVQNIIDFFIFANTKVMFFIVRVEKNASNLHVYADLKNHFRRWGPSYGIYGHHIDYAFHFFPNVLFWHRDNILESINDWQPDVPEFTWKRRWI